MSDSSSRPSPASSSSQGAAPLLNWSQDQLVRLEYEWRRLQRAFAYHPYLRIVSMRDDPPGEYEIEFKVRTLAVGESGELEYADAAPVRVWLPPSFPYSPPAVRPLTGLFHPNISWQGVHLSSWWQPTDTLVDFLKKIGDLLAWRVYDPEAIVNPLAMDWLEQNPTLLPLDAAADFAPEAGGEPLARLARYGPATLDQIRGQLSDLSNALRGSGPIPEAADVRAACGRTRSALKLFLDEDVPRALRADAASLDHWARGLPEVIPVYQFLRERLSILPLARSACQALAELPQALSNELAALDALVPAGRPQNALTALEEIPDLKVLEPIRLKLPELLRLADEQAKVLRDALATLQTKAPDPSQPPDSILGQQLRTELEALAAATRSVGERGPDVVGRLEPVLDRARGAARALRKIVQWREYLELIHRGRELEKKLAMWGAAGIHAYYVENQSGRFGPFQLEQVVELGTSALAVRSGGKDRLELVDARTNRVSASSDSGSATLDVTAAGGSERYPTTFQLTDRTEELVVQLDFLIRQTSEHLAAPAFPVPRQPSWCAAFLEALSEPEARQLIVEEHSRASERWRRLLEDVEQLAPLKARIQTWHLVHRLIDAAPRVVRTLNEQRARLQRSTDALAAIVARCPRDVETDRIVIPAKLVGPYDEQTRLRDRAQREVARAEAVLREMSVQVTKRLVSPATFGSNEAPRPVALPPLPRSFDAAIEPMDDAGLDEQISRLERLLGMPVRTPAWDAVRGKPPAAPGPQEKPNEPPGPKAL